MFNNWFPTEWKLLDKRLEIAIYARVCLKLDGPMVRLVQDIMKVENGKRRIIVYSNSPH